MPLSEDPDERRMFDQNVQTLGSPLAVVANALTILACTSPPHGSFAKQMAIMANEVDKALLAARDGQSRKEG